MDGNDCTLWYCATITAKNIYMIYGPDGAWMLDGGTMMNYDKFDALSELMTSMVDHGLDEVFVILVLYLSRHIFSFALPQSLKICLGIEKTTFFLLSGQGSW